MTNRDEIFVEHVRYVSVLSVSILLQKATFLKGLSSDGDIRTFIHMDTNRSTRPALTGEQVTAHP